MVISLDFAASIIMIELNTPPPTPSLEIRAASTFECGTV
jgi:hypothetical protein